MSRENHKRKPGFLKDGIYSLFSVLIPCLFLISIDLVSKNFIEGLNRIPWWFALVAVICNIIVDKMIVNGDFEMVNKKPQGNRKFPYKMMESIDIN